MQFKNTEKRYGLVTKSFHWVMAVMIIGMLAVGLYMSDLPIGELKLRLYGYHKETGILILMLVTLRLLWRLTTLIPPLPNTIPLWQKFIAHAMHWALYGFMFAMPITGWLMTSAAGLPPSFFGLFVMPALTQPDEHVMQLFQQIHEWLAYGFIAAICAHTGAALQHHFIDKDDILRRMIK